MAFPAPSRHARDAPSRRGRVALSSALALTAASLWVSTADAGETASRTTLPGSTAGATTAEQVTTRLHEAPQVVTPVVGPGHTSTPAWATRTPGELPAEAAIAYLLAARTIERAAPDCAVTAPLLAGLGRVVSDHGRLPLPRDLAAAPDTDGGRLDHDPRTDRPVGPMRMLPATWVAAGVDADGDGVRDPRDLDDAALAAAVYLCAAARTGSADERVDRALAAWSGASGFPATVRRLAAAYASPEYDAVWSAGASAPVAPRPATVVAVARRLPDHLSARTAPAAPTTRGTASVGKIRPPAAGPTDEPTPTPEPTPEPTSDPTPTEEPTPTPEPAPEPTPDPTPDPTPAPTPEPAPEQPAQSPDPAPISGVLARDGETWTVGGTPVDVRGIDPAALDSLLGRQVRVGADAAGTATLTPVDA